MSPIGCDNTSCAKASESDLTCATLVHIIFEKLEITTFTYTPRYEAIGILSFIGGYVGLWLGISLMTVYDFLESHLFRWASGLKKWLTRKSRLRVSAIHERPYKEYGSPGYLSGNPVDFFLRISEKEFLV
ncbi:uncharacterized protein TNCT_267261 [Trichonephila clavata]|uniref:Uncharacterized protein n=1 Tax=Trichonephila clavata TaxID=2740835 RepID=A0A8X6HQH6_TRICU|nr:uncharacterized protein TNCT_267261 [Trichonephila clavata]